MVQTCLPGRVCPGFPMVTPTRCGELKACTGGDQMMDEIAADEAGATGHEYAGWLAMLAVARIHDAA